MKNNAKKGSSEESPKIDSTLSKGLRILETLAGNSAGIGLTTLAAQLDLTKSNTFRLLRTLSTLGYVQQTDSKRYKTTMKVWTLGQEVIEELNLPEIAAPQMEMLSAATREAVYLAVLDGLHNLYIDRIDSPEPIRTFTRKGGSAPLHCIATGKSLLAGNYDRLRHLIKDDLNRYTDKTITSIRRLDANIQEIQKTGVAIDTGEYREGVYSIGAPIYDPAGATIAAIAVAIPEIRLADGQVEEISELVKKAAHGVTESIKAL